MAKIKKIVANSKVYQVRTTVQTFGKLIEISKYSKTTTEERKSIAARKTSRGSDKQKDSSSNLSSGTNSKQDLRLNAVFAGIGISIIDNEPKELIYISVHEMAFEFEENHKIVGTTKEINTFISADISHVQIDNMLDKSFPIIFGSQKLFRPEDKKEEDFTPFIQAKISKTDFQDENLTFTKFDSVQLQIGEMYAYCDLAIINQVANLATFVSKLLQDDIDKSVDYRHDTIYNPLKVKNLEQVCSDIETDTPAAPDLLVVTGNKVFIDYLHLGAIKIKVTLRLEKKAFDPTDKLAGLVVLYSFLATLSNISEAPIYFKELLLENTYQTTNEIVVRIRNNYVKQGIIQFYKLIGSIDLIGNPLGLVDTLASGVFEFVNEPRKGLMKGPKEFGVGLGKGFKSFITSIIGGSFGSISKITGSLYSLAKNVKGDKIDEDTFKKPDNILSGAYEGVKGGAMELATGFSGVVLQPYRGAKAEGVGGFFKGLGKGLVGVVISPVAAVLKFSTSVTQGIEGTARYINKGGVSLQSRMRFPRYITPANVIIPYNHDLSEAKLILLSLEDKKYATEEIIYFDTLPLKEKKNAHLVLVTDKRLFVLKNKDKAKFIVSYRKIKVAQTLSKKDKFILKIVDWEGEEHSVETTEYSAISNCSRYLPINK